MFLIEYVTKSRFKPFSLMGVKISCIFASWCNLLKISCFFAAWYKLPWLEMIALKVSKSVSKLLSPILESDILFLWASYICCRLSKDYQQFWTISKDLEFCYLCFVSSCTGYMRVILRTVVIDTPLLTSLSAIHPPKFALKAIVSQGKTQNIPDSVRLNFKTWL